MKCQDDKIKNKIVTLLQKRTRLVLKSESFLLADFEAVEWILSQDNLMVDEFSLLQALFRWAVFNEAIVTCNAESAEHQDCLHQLFECIQFDKVGQKNLRRFLLCTKLYDLVPIEEFRNDVMKQVLLENESSTNSVFRHVKSGCIKNRFSLEISVPPALQEKTFKRFWYNKIVELTDGAKFEVQSSINMYADNSGRVRVNVVCIS